MTPAALTVVEQQEDLAFLRGALELFHPGLHVYADEAVLDAAFVEAAAGFEEGASPLSLRADLSVGLEAIGCTHTTLSNTHTRAERGRFFPLDLVVVDDRLWRDPRAHAGPPQEILRVEGTAAAELLASLRARVPSDGRAVARKDAAIDQMAPSLITSLMGGRAIWRVETRVPGEAVQREGLPAVREKDLPTVQGAARPAYERVKGPDADVLVARVPTFAGSDRESRAAVASLQRAAAGADAVILDLRGNGGGRTKSLLDLWQLFAARPFAPYVAAWSRVATPHWTEDPASPGVYRAGSERLYPAVVPGPDALRMPVVVIADGTTGSSASDLAFYFQWEGRGALVGSETASGRWLQNCENYLNLRLPNSHITITVPLRTLVTADEEGRGHGVIPEVEVAPGVDDLASGRDPVYERALAVARELAKPRDP